MKKNKKIHKIIISICARNEEGNIEKCLESVVSNCRKLPKHLQVNFFICLNGCIDQTEEIVDKFIHKYNADFSIKKLISEEGLINAQRLIVSESLGLSPDIFLFIAADTILDDFCLLYLYQSFTFNKDLIVSYANSVPIKYGHFSTIAQASYVFEAEPQVMTERRYFISRAFGIKDWNIPTPCDIQLRIRSAKNKIGDNLSKFLNLDSGIILDDVFLSYRIIHQYGPGSISYCKNTIVYHPVIRNLKNYYLVSRRTFIEKEKIKLLFPEFNYLTEFFARHKIKEEIVKLSLKKKFYWYFYRLVGDFLWFVYNLERFLAKKFGIKFIKNQWNFTNR